MELDFAMLAENAEQGNSGNLHIYGGGFNNVQTQAVPCVLPRISLVARFRQKRAEAKATHILRISLTNPEGEEKEIQVIEGFSPPDGLEGQDTFAVLVAQLSLNLTLVGQYFFTLRLDEEPLKEIPLFVALVQSQAPGET